MANASCRSVGDNVLRLVAGVELQNGLSYLSCRKADRSPPVKNSQVAVS